MHLLTRPVSSGPLDLFLDVAPCMYHALFSFRLQDYLVTKAED